MARPRIHPLPSISALRERLAYDPLTGVFTSLVRPNGRPLGTVMNVGYLFIHVSQSVGMMLAHRLAWALHYGEWPNGEIDHRDTNKLNNRIDNLRLATRTQQSVNSFRRNKTGYIGVDYRCGKYRAKISVKGRKVHLGMFDTAELAAEAYARAARELHGEYAFAPIGTLTATINITALAA